MTTGTRVFYLALALAIIGLALILLAPGKDQAAESFSLITTAFVYVLGIVIWAGPERWRYRLPWWSPRTKAGYVFAFALQGAIGAILIFQASNVKPFSIWVEATSIVMVITGFSVTAWGAWSHSQARNPVDKATYANMLHEHKTEAKPAQHETTHRNAKR